VIAVDTNVLIYAHVDSFPKHESAAAALTALAEGPAQWGIPAQCLVEFVRIVTHPRVLVTPMTVAQARAALDAVLASPTANILGPGPQHWSYLSEALEEGDARGNLAFDASIAAICTEAGVTELLTEDRDFARFAGIAVRRL
jgi:toxin-antitoxin system PIN domain toxin